MSDTSALSKPVEAFATSTFHAPDPCGNADEMRETHASTIAIAQVRPAYPRDTEGAASGD